MQIHIFSVVESLKSGNYLSDVIRKTFRKRNSAEVSMLKNEFTEGFYVLLYLFVRIDIFKF